MREQGSGCREKQLEVPVDSLQVKQEAMQDTGRGFFPCTLCFEPRSPRRGRHEEHEEKKMGSGLNIQYYDQKWYVSFVEC